MRNSTIPKLAGLLLAFMISGLSAQSQEIQGQVTDASSGQPLAGVNVFVQNSTVGAATDLDGMFSIVYVATADFTLVINFIGYKRQTREFSPGDNTSNMSIALDQDVFQGETIVVTGLGSSRSKAVAEVAVARVDVEALTAINSYQDFSQLLRGKTAGVDIKKASGNIGGGFRFDVRSGGGLNGNEQPVIYIDGVRADHSELKFNYVGGQGTSTLADLNPEDIATVEILKGPAAASSYGTSGSNGVILITTKKGKMTSGVGKNFNVTYKQVSGTNKQSYFYERKDAETWEDVNNIFSPDGGVIEGRNISITGGNAAARYYISYDRRYEEGILKTVSNNYMDRRSVRANMDVFPSAALSLSISTGYTLNEITRPENDNNTFGWLGNTLLFANSYVFLDSAAIAAIEDITVSQRFVGSIQGRFRPFPDTPMLSGLAFNATFGLDDSNVRIDNTKSPDFRYGSIGTRGRRYATVRQVQQFTANVGASFTANLGGIQSTTSITSQNFDRRYRRVFLSKTDYLTSLIMNLGAGSELTSIDEVFSHRRESGILLSEEISLGNQFFATLSIRQDFASTIGAEAETVTYPAARFAWRADQLGILPSLFNMLKFRFAYGETGVLPGLDDGIPLLWEAEEGGVGVGGVLSAIGNDAIEPERVKETEIGIDAELFGIISIEATMFKVNAENSIVGRRNAPSTGKTASSVPFNVGKVEGSGYEILVQLTPFSSPRNRLDITATGTWQQNKVIDLDGAPPIFDGFDVNVITEGLPKYEFYLPIVLGAKFDSDGRYDGVDIKDDSLETSGVAGDGRYAQGNPLPKMYGSLSGNLKLFGFLNLYALLETKQGHVINNITARFGARFGNHSIRNDLGVKLGLRDSDPDNPIDTLAVGSAEYIEAAHAYARTDGGGASKANWLEDASYVKLREMSASVSLAPFLGMVGLQKTITDLTVVVSANNLMTWTNYSGPDPEVGWNGALNSFRGQDFLTLQTPKSFTITLRASF